MKPLNIVQDNRRFHKPKINSAHNNQSVKSAAIHNGFSVSVYSRDDENFDGGSGSNSPVYPRPLLLTKPVKARSTVEVRRPLEKIKQLPPTFEVDVTDIPLHDETSMIDLRMLSKVYDRRGVDFPPFFRTYDYESRYDKDDLVKLTIENDTAFRKRPVRFGKEMEYRELKRSVTTLDYISYYLLGIDRSGYFELAKERAHFMDFPMSHYTVPLEQKDPALGQPDDLFEENDFDFDSSRDSDEPGFEI